MLTQTHSARSAALCIAADLIDRACALALTLACCYSFKLIALKALLRTHMTTPLTKLARNASRVNHKKYSAYTKRFDKTLLAAKTDCTSPQSDYSMLTPGYIEIINRKRVHQIIVDLTQATKRTACSKACERTRALNFIIDKSASMIGEQHKTTQLMDAILAQTALDYEINGYTTRCWRNSNAFKL